MLRHVLGRLLSPIDAAVWRLRKVAEPDDICIADVSVRKNLREEFGQRIAEALDLAAAKDPRRYRRIRRNIRFIVHRELGSGCASYRPDSLCCFIDLTRFLECGKSRKHTCFQLAATLIHEATHREICRHRIADTPMNRVRMDRLCSIEEMRFARRVDPLYYRAYREVFSDWGRWEKFWEQEDRVSGWQRLLRSRRRRKEVAGVQPGASGSSRPRALSTGL